MSGARIVIDDAALQEVLGAIIARSDSLRPFFEGVRDVVANATRERFLNQHGPSGAPWLPPKPETVARRKRSKGSQALIDTMAMMDSIYPSSIITDDRLEVGTNAIQARVHQEGSLARNIPARPFLGISVQDEGDVRDLLVAHLAQGLKGLS
jgi:phage gpG-like protein